MNKLIYELTMNNWYLRNIEKNYGEKESSYEFYHQKLKGFQLDIYVDKKSNKPTKWELWASRFNHVGIHNNIDEIYTVADYKQLLNQLSNFVIVLERVVKEIKDIIAPFGIPMKENNLTYDGSTGLDLRDIYEYNK